MKCEDIQFSLNEFIDNELDFENSQIIKEHINDCTLCFREFENIKRLKKHLVNFQPTLSNDFDLKLSQRINAANHKSRLYKAFPLAASIALTIPLIHYLTFEPTISIHNEFIIELQSIGKVISYDDDNFHKWTQLSDSNESLECSGSISGSYCYFDLSYFPEE